MEPFLDLMVAMDQNNGIGINNKVPWNLPGDWAWLMTISTTTVDPKKRNAIIVGRLTHEEMGSLAKRWYSIVITSKPNLVKQSDDVICVSSFEQAISVAHNLHSKNDKIENVFVLGGVQPYEQAIRSKLVKRVYLTRIFAEFNCDTRWTTMNLTDYKRIKRNENEILASEDDQIKEENGIKYQFQVYDFVGNENT